MSPLELCNVELTSELLKTHNCVSLNSLIEEIYLICICIQHSALFEIDIL